MTTGREKTLPKGKCIDGVSFHIYCGGRRYSSIVRGSSVLQGLGGLAPTLTKHTFSNNPEDLD